MPSSNKLILINSSWPQCWQVTTKPYQVPDKQVNFCSKLFVLGCRVKTAICNPREKLKMSNYYISAHQKNHYGTTNVLSYQELILFTVCQTLSSKNKWVDQDQRLLTTSYKYQTYTSTTDIGKRKKRGVRWCPNSQVMREKLKKRI